MFESAAAPPRFRARFPSVGGGRLVSALVKLLLVLAPLIFFRACFITYVPPSQIALRQISFGPNKGLQKHLVLPGYRRSTSAKIRPI